MDSAVASEVDLGAVGWAAEGLAEATVVAERVEARVEAKTAARTGGAGSGEAARAVEATG